MLRRVTTGMVVLFLALGGSTAALSQPSQTGEGRSTSVLREPFVQDEGKKGLDLLYNMRTEEARAIFQEIDQRYPAHPVGPFLEGLNLWWTIMIDLTDTSHDEAFFDQMNEVIDRCDDLLDENEEHFDAQLFKAAAHGFKARLASNRSNWLKAIRNGRTAIKYARTVAEEAPSETGDYVFGKGLYDYYAAILEDEYPATKSFTWMMADGDKERGLRLLRKTADEGRFVKTEAIYYLAQIYYLYEDDYQKSRHYVQRLRERHPKNPYFHNFEGQIYARWGRWGQTRDVFESVVERAADDEPGYNAHMQEIAHYYLGRDRLRRNDYDQALDHFTRVQRLADRDVDDNRYRILAVLYQGMTYDAMDRRELAKKHYRHVLELDDPVGAHDRAERYLDEPYS
ncbi:MAG: tetratricopeptide repeat protein [Salinivenus sp.]